MPKPKDTPEPTQVDNSDTPPAAPTVDVQAILARLEALEADRAALQAENEALKAAPSRDEGRDAVARQLADAAFRNTPYANVTPNINADDYKNPPRSEVEVSGEMPLTVDGKVTMVPYKNKIRSF